MATDTFLKIGDIKGESTDVHHKDEIEIESWSWGITQPAGGGSSGGGGGKASFQDLLITHFLDRSTPGLMRACATGEHIREAVLTARKAGSPQKEFIIIRMTDVIVASVHPSAGPGGTMETLSLRFGRVDFEYKPQKADGSLDAGVHFGFDINGNRPL